ncbi:TonB-dependent receptor [Aliidiomarina taiwanensis]|uniref:TonB-dependent receptor n=1 Tax=Aliidiomarina taiwanensis TaxID=946228 RepID=A0A432X138_9GAMM|nr:TonB-dependent receptor [Aliidiomarina taiwanensis]RUO39885.1 TonB-dependent receptor [Aliidiomarina taiwanensis]
MKKLALLAFAPCLLAAQEKPIEVIEVIGRSSDTPVLPSEEQAEGLFGLAQSLQDIPRAATIINAQLMDAAAITTLHDIARFTPNSFAAAGFGNPSLPTLRGQLGELYEAGMRRQAGNNGLGIPMSFNAIEGMAIVKGAPPIMLGSSQRVGGFVNLQTKRARLQAMPSQLQLQLGQWNKYRAQVDHNWVLEEGKQGFRVSAEYVDEGSFYDYHQHNSKDVLLAYTYAPSRDTQLEVSAELYDVRWTDNAGINRPTQNLIDHNLYITGQGRQPNGSYVPGPGAVVSPTGEVRIARSTTLTDPLDSNTAETALLHAKFQHWFNDQAVLVNRTYYQYLTREGINQNSFVEIIDGAHTFENRTELHINKLTIVGLNLRINDVLGYSQFTTEADNPIDLTGPLSNRRIPLTDAQKARLIELRPGVFVSPGSQYDINGDGVGDFNLSDTTDSTSYQWGVFAQHEVRLSERWRVTGGVRADYYEVTAKDPLAPEGVTPARDSHSDWLNAVSFSTQYKLSPNATLYGTAYVSDSTSNSMAGGHSLTAAGTIDSQQFATENTLYEAGVKYAPESATWYADLVLFSQTRSLRNRDGSNSGIHTQGIEGQWHYASQQGYWVTFAASYIDARWDNSPALQGTRQVADVFDASRPDLIVGTGLGSPNFTVFPASNQQLQGIPEVQASLVAGWRISERWFVGGDVSYTQAYPLDYLQTVFIRDQHTLNINTGVRIRPELLVRLDVFNVTDQDNWSPVFEGGYFGATLVFPAQPRHARVSLTYQF